MSPQGRRDEICRRAYCCHLQRGPRLALFSCVSSSFGVGVLNHLRFNVTQRNCRGSGGRGQHIPFGKGLGLSSLKGHRRPREEGTARAWCWGGGGAQGSEGSGPSPIGQHSEGPGSEGHKDAMEEARAPPRGIRAPSTRQTHLKIEFVDRSKISPGK